MRKPLHLLLIFGALFNSLNGNAQLDFYKYYYFEKSDSLRGALRPQRTCYDVYYYDLNLSIDVGYQTVRGYNDIYFEAKEDFSELQIDLFYNLFIDDVQFQGQSLKYDRLYNAVFINFPPQQKGSKGVFRVLYSGKPKKAVQPPWEGGFVWSRAPDGSPWFAVACEGIGASIWWPNKDHLSDKPDSMSITVTLPDTLFCVANGQLRKQEALGDGKKRFHWFVSYPINNYNVSLNVAKYEHFTDIYADRRGRKMTCDYYVLPVNLEKARVHFSQIKNILACYEEYFGRYPFWRDGLSVVETPYPGMEHQSAIAYGNQYQIGYLGEMIPKGMEWDYILVHELGHEYWGNSISCSDMADLWIHESFTTYMEALFVECQSGYDEYVRYLNFQRPFIQNKEPILGPPNVNWYHWESTDHYYKGAWMLHTLRHSLNDDNLWFTLLKSLYEEFAFSNVQTEDILSFFYDFTGQDLSYFFSQYLDYRSIPSFQYKLKERDSDILFQYRWKADVKDFHMPLWVWRKGQKEVLYPTTTWQEIIWRDTRPEELEVATELFYIETQELD